jgi:GNAT superfamily N-acetyltransferase
LHGDALTIIIRDFLPEHVHEVFLLIHEVFLEYIAPRYSPEGREEFMSFIDPQKTLGRQINHHILEAFDTDAGSIVGIIEVRNDDHISLLFIRSSYQRHGIGRLLFHEAVRSIPMQDTITANAAPDAVPFYNMLGFQEAGPLQEKQGLLFVPMRRGSHQ